MSRRRQRKKEVKENRIEERRKRKAVERKKQRGREQKLLKCFERKKIEITKGGSNWKRNEKVV